MNLACPHCGNEIVKCESCGNHIDLTVATPATPADLSAEQQFSEAVDRVYAKYGPNLPAFFEDVQKWIRAKAQREKAPNT